MPRQQPPQQPPPVLKLLVRYGKLGRAGFASHRDFARGFERALNRAGIPMAYSSGFSPHPRISYINPAQTGALSEAEYLVIGLRQHCEPGEVMTKLNAVMPEGFPVLDVTQAADVHFDASWWEARLEADPDDLARAVAAFLAEPEITVARQTKNGSRLFDARGPVVALFLCSSGTEGDHLTRVGLDARAWPERRESEVALTMVIRHTEPLVRPDDVLTALREHTGLAVEPVALKRLRQGGVAELAGLARAEGSV